MRSIISRACSPTEERPRFWRGFTSLSDDTSQTTDSDETTTDPPSPQSPHVQTKGSIHFRHDTSMSRKAKQKMQRLHARQKETRRLQNLIDTVQRGTESTATKLCARLRRRDPVDSVCWTMEKGVTGKAVSMDSDMSSESESESSRVSEESACPAPQIKRERWESPDYSVEMRTGIDHEGWLFFDRDGRISGGRLDPRLARDVMRMGSPYCLIPLWANPADPESIFERWTPYTLVPVWNPEYRKA